MEFLNGEANFFCMTEIAQNHFADFLCQCFQQGGWPAHSFLYLIVYNSIIDRLLKRYDFFGHRTVLNGNIHFEIIAQ